MSYGQGGPESQWDPWKPHSQQPSNNDAGQTPDWAALAEASEVRNKRRKLMFIGGGAVATVAVGAAVAMAVVSADGGGGASGGPSSLSASASLPSGSGSGAPSFAPTSAPPPLDPKDFISSAQKDTAPLSTGTLFPGTRLTVGATVYKKGATADTRNCASAASDALSKVLTGNDCTRVLRVSYVKDDVAVTVGVAVFATEAQAGKAKVQAQSDDKSIVKSLSGAGIKSFCDSAICRSTTNSYGRYAYFTIAGFTSGKNVTTKDTQVFSAGDDLATFAYHQIGRRGEAQASAAAGG
jgi:hypothetical protein